MNNPNSTSVLISVATLLAGETERVMLIAGGNFSGRSGIIQALAEKATASGDEAILIPPEIHSALSGLVPTVEDELLLHLCSDVSNSQYWELAKTWGLLDLKNRDPHTLSGGQQTLLVILCKLALHPKLLGLDGSLEQLDPANSARVLTALYANDYFPPPSVAVMAHNGSWPEQVKSPASVPAIRIASQSQHTSPPMAMNIDGFNPPVISDPVTVEMRGIAFNYPGSHRIFSDLELTLHPGRIYRIAGPNGAGKSTFARLLCGILRPTAGTIFVNGREFNSFKQPGILARLHFQNPDTQLFAGSVHDEIATLPPARRDAALNFAGLTSFLNTHPFDLPYVLRKRLALTVIFHTDAPWLIFDEPSIGLDTDSQATISIALKRLAAAGYGVLVISHNQRFESLLSPEIINLNG
jgi:energy-coupling factor transporter ATP-binding protein EcfA2